MNTYGRSSARYLWGDASNLTVQLVHPLDPSDVLLSALSKSIWFLERIVVACCHTQYVVVGDIITTSFQGKRVKFEVLDAKVDRDTLYHGGASVRVVGEPVIDVDEVIRLNESMMKLRVEVRDDVQGGQEQPPPPKTTEQIQDNLIGMDDEDRRLIDNLLFDVADKFATNKLNMKNMTMAGGVRAPTLYQITYGTKIQFTFDDRSSFSPSNDGQQHLRTDDTVNTRTKHNNNSNTTN